MSRQPGGDRPLPGRRPSSRDPKKQPGSPQPQEQNWRWAVVALVALVAAAVILPGLISKPKREQIGYGTLIDKAKSGMVLSATINNDTGRITGVYKDADKAPVHYAVTGPHP